MDERDPFDADFLGAGDPRPAAGVSGDPFDADFGDKPKEGGSSVLGATARGAAYGVVPAAGGLAGAGAGAALGAKWGAAAGALVPGFGEVGVSEAIGAGVGAIAGGLIGGFGGSFAADRAQDIALHKLPETWTDPLDQQRRADQEQHPYASFFGGLVPFMATMGVGGGAAARLPADATAMTRLMKSPYTSRLFSGALMGGIELGVEASEGNVDWNKVAISTGFGMIFTRPNRYGEKIEGFVPNVTGLPTAAETIQAAQRRTLFRDMGAAHDQPVQPPPEFNWNDVADYQPTVIDASAYNVAGSGIDESVFQGTASRNPAEAEHAMGLAREESALLGPMDRIDINEVARRSEGELIDHYERTKAHRDELAARMRELRTPDDAEVEAAQQRVSDLQKQYDDHVSAAKGYTGGAEARRLRAALRDAQGDVQSTVARKVEQNADEIEAITKQYQAVDYALRDLGPQVGAARRRAAERVGSGLVPPPAPEPAPASSPVDAQPAAAPPPAPVRSPAEQKAFIADDVTRQLVALGRSRKEAADIGAIVANYFSTRAARFKGALGTAEALYRKEGNLWGTKSRLVPGTPEEVGRLPAEDRASAGARPAEPFSTEAAAAEHAAKVEADRLRQIEAAKQAQTAKPAAEKAKGPTADEAHAKAESLGVLNLVRALQEAGSTPDEISAFIGKKMSPAEIAALEHAKRATTLPVDLKPEAPAEDWPPPEAVRDKALRLDVSNTVDRMGAAGMTAEEIAPLIQNKLTVPEIHALIAEGPRAKPAEPVKVVETAKDIADLKKALKADLTEIPLEDVAPPDPFVELKVPAPEAPIAPPEEVAPEAAREPEGGPSESTPIANPEPPADESAIPATGEAAPIPAPEAAQASEPQVAFIDNVKAKLLAGEKPFRTIVDARALAKEHGLEFPEGESANKHVDELVERAVVESARQIVEQHRAEGRTPQETYERIVKLYDDQPNLSTRTSTSVAEQAYSTPAPLAYVASHIAGIGPDTRVLEPTAGNGMLLIAADPRHAVTNELNKTRASALRAQGFNPSKADGAAWSTFADRAGQMDAVIANPPFGSVREGGKVKQFVVDGWDTTQIDHAISLNALKTMKPDGRAVLIIGGVKAESEAERAKGYQSAAKRRFFHQLLSKYNVTDVFTVDGGLYAKQGAGWPVDVIVIDGKGKSGRAPLTKEPPPLLKSWDEIGEKLNGNVSRGETDGSVVGGDSRPGAETAQGVGLPEAGNGMGDVAPAGGEPVGMGAPDDRPGALDGTRDSSEPGPVGSERPVHEGEGEPAGNGGELRGPDLGADTDGGRPVEEPPAPAPVRRARSVEATDGQPPYEPASQTGVRLNTLLPANLRDATNESLDRLERAQGPVDRYVAKALDYKFDDEGMFFTNAKGEKVRPFSAEQIDAIGLGISNIQKGEGFIIGDQTGIGKGRVVAAMIAYARRKGLIPIFVTEKPDLFGDMWRDLHDIGMDRQLGRPIDMTMTNSNTRVALDDEALEWQAERDDARAEGLPDPPVRGKFSPSQSIAKATANMRAIIDGSRTPDVIFTNYSQMQSVAGNETDRRAFLREIAPRSFLIMDEAHNAGGQAKSEDPRAEAAEKKGPPARSEVFREAINKAHSVMYSSATYAKSPSVMTLYSKTDMAKAVGDVKELPELITRGGVPLQQVVASMLAKAGQYMRRERSFDGVSYDHENVPVDAKSYEEFSNGLREVFKFDRAFEKERSKLAQSVAGEHGGGRQNDSGTGDASASSTSFGSVMHNVINQMIVALKAQKTAERAIQALQAGEKPVIALSKTNAAFIKDMAAINGSKVGDVLNITFADILKRYLERTRRVTIKLGNDEKKHVMIPLEDMSPEARAMYAAAQNALSKIGLGDLPVSPIDHIRNEITKAGYTVREVTGRDMMIDYSGGMPMLTRRPSSEVGAVGKKLTVKHFNDGKADAVILNQSGSTGISMHASSKFIDQRRRRMIIGEADPNIDTHMQMLGRVHRTGQVIPPAYTHLSADIPAEVRPTAVLMRKMASLNANTTGAKKSRFTSDAVDFMNKYGDRVIASVLHEDPETWVKLGKPAVFDDNGRSLPDAASKATGKLTLLNPEEQQAFLDKVTDRYKALIEELDATGENDLEAKSVDLQARPLETSVLKEATGPSPFQSAVNLEKVSVKSQGRAFSPKEVADRVAEALRLGAGDRDFARDMRELSAKGEDFARTLTDDVRERAASLMKIELAIAKDPETKEKVKAKYNGGFVKFRDLAKTVHPGATVTLNVKGEEMPAVVIGFAQEKEAKNPVALSSWNAIFAVPNGSRSFGIPLSRLDLPGGEAREDAVHVSKVRADHAELADKFETARKEGRETRYMVTGNILAGFSQLSGQIINHTMEDGSTRPAILLGRAFDPKKYMETRAVRFDNGEHVLKFLDKSEDQKIASSDGVIRITKDGPYYEFEVPSSRREGGRYFADSAVRAVFDNWQRKGAVMRGEVRADKATALIDALRDVGAKFETRKEQDLATSLRPEKTELSQTGRDKQGSISFDKEPIRGVIRLFSGKADASTAIHELGHKFVEDMRRDSVHEAAPQQIKDDWETLKRASKMPDDPAADRRGWVAAHEQIARWFEQYLHEGHAPSKELEGVFARFKNWMLGVYKTVSEIFDRRQVQMSPDVKAVFDRWLAEEPLPTTVAPDAPQQATLHGMHAAEAQRTPVADAEPGAERIRSERTEAIPPKEVEHEIAQAVDEVEAQQAEAAGAKPAGEAGSGDGGRGEMDVGGEEAGAKPGGGDVGEGAGAERDGGNATPSESSKPTQPAGGPSSGRPEPSGAAGSAALAPKPAELLEPPTRFVDKAGNIRLDNVNSAEDLKEAARELAAQNGDFVGARRGVMHDADLMALQEAIGDERVTRKTLGEASNAEEAVAIQRIAAQAWRDMHNAASTYKQTRSEADLLVYVERQQRATMMQGYYSQATAEAGRALRAMRKVQEFWTPGAEAAKAASEGGPKPTPGGVIAEATGRTLYQKAAEALLVASYDDPRQIARFNTWSRRHSFGRMILEYWINGLISGPATHTTYVVGNALLSVEKGLLITPVAAGLGALRPMMGRDASNVVHLGEVRARGRAAWDALPAAVQASADSWRSGITGKLPGNDTFNAMPMQGSAAPFIQGIGLNEAATWADARGAIYAAHRGFLEGMLSIGKILQAAPAGAPRAEWVYSGTGVIPDLRVGAGIVPIGTLARAPSRAVATIHTFFRSMNYSIEKNAGIYRQAANEARASSMTSEQFATRIAELTNNTPEDIVSSSTTLATDMTLMGPAGELVRRLSGVINWAPSLPFLGETPIFKFVDPFIHIASNVIDQAIVKRTPVGFLSAELRRDLLGHNGATAQDLAQARMIVGSAMALGFGALAANGSVSGSGPKDRDKAAMWRLAGNQPHSVKIGDIWYSMNRLGPLGMLLGMSADLYDVGEKATQGEMLEAAAMLHHAIVQNVLDESFMRGPAELIEAIEDPGRYGEKYVRNFVSSFVPYSVGAAQVARAVDPYARQSRTVIDAMKAKIPGISEQLYPRLDIWGQPIPSREAFIAAGITAIYEQRVSRDPVNLALAELGIGIAPVDRSIRNVKLTEQQYDDFARIAGRMAKQRLDVFVRSPEWQQWPAGLRADAVKTVIDHSREAARGVMFMKFPSILADATKAKMQRKGLAE